MKNCLMSWDHFILVINEDLINVIATEVINFINSDKFNELGPVKTLLIMTCLKSNNEDLRNFGIEFIKSEKFNELDGKDKYEFINICLNNNSMVLKELGKKIQKEM